jgi:hypothetical protein
MRCVAAVVRMSTSRSLLKAIQLPRRRAPLLPKFLAANRLATPSRGEARCLGSKAAGLILCPLSTQSRHLWSGRAAHNRDHSRHNGSTYEEESRSQDKGSQCRTSVPG